MTLCCCYSSGKQSSIASLVSHWLTMSLILAVIGCLTSSRLVIARDSRGGVQHQTVAPVKVFVDNQNDFPPVISDCPRHLEVLEEQSQPLMEIFRAKDEDKSVNGAIEFSLKSIDTGENIQEKFKITNHDKGASATLTLLSPVDREEKEFYNFYVVAEDHGDPVKNSTCLITVTVRDINDNPPVLDVEPEGKGNEISVFEEMKQLPVNIVVSAIDPDKSYQRDADVRFAIESCTCGKGIFKIDQISGVVTLFQPLDYEKMKTCLLNVSATDEGGRGLTSYIDIKIKIIDRNDNPPVFPGIIKKHFTTPPSTGDTITVLTVEDADEDDTSIFSFEDDSTSTDFFLEGNNSEILKAKKELTENRYLILIRATNKPLPLTATGLVEITIGANEPEHLSFSQSSYSALIDESSPSDTRVTQVLALDPTQPQESLTFLKYSLFSPTVAGALKINSTSGEIFVDQSDLLDYEKVQQITVHVQATAEIEGGGGESRQIVGYTTVVVSLGNLNDNQPYFISDYNQSLISEGKYSPQNPLAVGDIQVRDEDQRNDGLNLTVVSIEPSTDPPVFVFQHHMLLAVGELDRESVPEYRVTIRVTDSVTESSKFTHSEEKVITIKVLDVNDNPAIFPNFQSPVYIAEDAEPGKVIGNYVAKDEDEVSNVTYSLVYNQQSNNDVTSGQEQLPTFVMQSNGNLVLNDVLNYEERAVYVLKLRAFDGIHENERELVVKVEDVNDNAPVFDKEIYSAQIDSGIPINSPFIKVLARDVDSGKNGAVTYSLSSDKMGVFKIDEETGDIFAKRVLPQTNSNEMTDVTVKATDNGDPKLSSTVKVGINIIDNREANESPIILPINTVSVPEDKKVNSEIARVIAHFQDGSKSSYIKYKLVSGNEERMFNLVLGAERNTYGGVLILNKRLDREDMAKYELKVLAYDERKPSLNSTASFIVTVQDVNDIKPKFMGAPYRANVSLNASVGKAIIRVHAEDGDEGANAALVYRIVSGPQKSFFTIDNNTGWISLRKSLDITLGDELKLTVSVSDPLYTVKTSVYVNVINQNASWPMFPKSYYSFQFEENQLSEFAFKLGALNGQQKVISGLRYEIVDQEVLHMFYINPYNGEVEFIKPIDYEEASSYTFHIKVTNNISQSDIATVHVLITGEDEFPPQFTNTPYSFTVRADAEKNTRVGKVTATDDDRDEEARFVFTKNYPNFLIDPVTGIIYVNESLQLNKQWIPENAQTSTSSGIIAITPLLVEASSGKKGSRQKVEAVSISVDVGCCPGLIPPAEKPKDPLSGVIIAVVVVAIAITLVVAGIAVLACVFHRTKNGGGHPPSGSGSPIHGESFNNGFHQVDGISPRSTPSRNSSMHIYPNTLPIQSGGLVYNQASQRSQASSGRGSAMNEADSEMKRIAERNYLLNAKAPDFLAYQKDSGFNDMPDNVSVDSVAQNIAEVIFGEDDQHVYASASIESVNPFAEDIGRTGMSSLIYSKLQEIGADQFDPHKAFQGSFNSLVGHDLHENYNWDHLLNWNPQYHQLAQVFADIAKLKDDGDSSPGALPEPSPHLFVNGATGVNPPTSYSKVQQNQLSTPNSKKNANPPFFSTMVQPGTQAVHPVAYRHQNGIVSGHPNSRTGYPMPPPASSSRAGSGSGLSNIATTSYNGNNNLAAVPASNSVALTQKPSPAFNQSGTLPQQPTGGQPLQQRNHKLSNGSLTGSSCSSNGSAKLPPANHKSLSKQQHHLAMGVNGASAANNRNRSSNPRNFIREEQV